MTTFTSARLPQFTSATRRVVLSHLDLTVILDRDRARFDNPESDEPAMVYSTEHSATLWEACNEGSLDFGEQPLTEAQSTWLFHVAEYASRFFAH